MSLASDTAPFALDPDLLAEVADHRARGRSWEATAAAVEWDVADLKRAARRDPNYEAAYARAEREFEQEGAAEGMQKLRGLLRDPDPKIARDAANIIFRYLAGKRRDETRLEVERIRAESAEAKRAKAEAKRAAAGEPEPDISPEQAKHIEAMVKKDEIAYAEKLARENGTVYLWSGCHKIGDTAPDETDIPLRVFRDQTVRGREIFWAITLAPPADFDGPFLPPPGAPI